VRAPARHRVIRGSEAASVSGRSIGEHDGRGAALTCRSSRAL
jgi:hypothetical protein